METLNQRTGVVAEARRAGAVAEVERPMPVVGRPTSVALMGVPLDAFTSETLLEYLIAQSNAGQGGSVMTPNLDILYGVIHDDVLLERVLTADIRVADGMPLIWASRLQGTPLPARVAGSDLVYALAPRLAETEKSLFLLGGEPGTAERAAQILKQQQPGLRIAGTYCPEFGYEQDPTQIAEILKAVSDANPDFVYVGLPFPKASALIEELRVLLPQAWSLAVGVSFSFISGEIKRAPRWLRRLGCEWIHRLVQEPRRLGRRYLIHGIPLGLQLLAGSYAARHRPFRRA